MTFSAYEGAGVQPVHRSGDRRAKKGPRESPKGPNSLGHIIYFYFLFYFFLISTQIFNFERSLICHRSPKAVLLRVAKFLLEALLTYNHSLRIQNDYFTLQNFNLCKVFSRIKTDIKGLSLHVIKCSDN